MSGSGQNRPSSKEAYQKVAKGLAAVEQGRRLISVAKHLSEAYDFLGVGTAAELWVEVAELLKELLTEGPYQHYVGGRPPERSYEDPPLAGKELWAYAWDSSKFGKEVYLKFALAAHSNAQKTNTGEIFYFVDCHESRPPK